MSTQDGNDNSTRSVIASLTAECITQRLIDGGQKVVGDTFTDDDGVAWLIGCCERTLRSWRSKEWGPPAKLIIGRWLYPIAELSDWLQSQWQAGDTRFFQWPTADKSRKSPATSDIANAPHTVKDGS